MGISKSEAYSLLELPLGASLDDIRTSYKRLALKWHPDKHSNSPESTKTFQQISTAYKKLTDTENDNEVEMSLDDMINMFQSIFNSRFSFGGFNPFAAAFGDCHHNGHDGYDSYDSYDDDYDDDDDEDDDYTLESIKARRELKKQKETGITDNTNLTAEEIEKNAKKLIIDEEKEKKKAEKRRSKKKRQKEKKKLEKQKDEDTQSRPQPSQQKEKKTKQVNGNHNNANIASNQATTNNKRRDRRETRPRDNTTSSSSDEESFDMNAAFFNRVVTKQIKAGVLPEDTQLHNNKPQKTKDSSKSQQGETLDPSILRSRQLAIRGNQMANMGHYQAAIELFTEAIKLDPKDFRFYGNRSYCFDRQQQYEKALRDADKAINLAPDWPKGYFRKGRALAGLKLFADAENAFTQVLKLDHKCDDAMQELTRVRTHQLTEMGFSKQQAEAAIKHYGSVQQALDSLLAGVVAENSLAGEVYVSDEEDYGGTVNGHASAGFGATNHVSSPPITMNTATSNPAKDVKMDARNPEGLTSLWVGNVLPEVTDKKLVQVFSKYGTVTSVRCLPEKFCAFVNFSNKVGAGKAMQGLQGAEVGGQRLLIKFPDNPVGTATNSVITKSNTTTRSSKPTPTTTTTNEAQSGPVNGDECYFWRTTGCTFGKECRFKHVPSSKGVDKKPWQK